MIKKIKSALFAALVFHNVFIFSYTQIVKQAKLFNPNPAITRLNSKKLFSDNLSPKSLFISKKYTKETLSGYPKFKIYNFNGLQYHSIELYLGSPKTTGFYLEITGSIFGGLGKSHTSRKLVQAFSDITNQEKIIEIDSDKIPMNYLGYVQKNIKSGKIVIGSLNGSTKSKSVNYKVYIFTEPFTRIAYFVQRIIKHILKGELYTAFLRTILEIPLLTITIPLSLIQDLIEIFTIKSADIYLFNSPFSFLLPNIPLNNVYQQILPHSTKRYSFQNYFYKAA